MSANLAVIYTWDKFFWIDTPTDLVLFNYSEAADVVNYIFFHPQYDWYYPQYGMWVD